MSGSAASLDGKVVLITGAAGGLGAALARQLAGAGARIVAGDIRLAPAAATAAALRAQGACAHAIGFDVADPAGAERAVADTIKVMGRLDVLINNAGTDIALPLESLSELDWQRVIGTNLSRPFLLSKFAAASMRDGGGGHIVNIATAARRAWPNASAYHASKWGLLGLSYALHEELRQHGVRVTALVAGGMRTPFLLERFPGVDPETLLDPASVAAAILAILLLPPAAVVAEMTIVPVQSEPWP